MHHSTHCVQNLASCPSVGKLLPLAYWILTALMIALIIGVVLLLIDELRK